MLDFKEILCLRMRGFHKLAMGAILFPLMRHIHSSYITNTDLAPSRVSTWALEEARRRLEAEGILPDPEAKGNKN